MRGTALSLKVVGLDMVRSLLHVSELIQADSDAVKKRRVGLHSPTDVTAFHWG